MTRREMLTAKYKKYNDNDLVKVQNRLSKLELECKTYNESCLYKNAIREIVKVISIRATAIKEEESNTELILIKRVA